MAHPLIEKIEETPETPRGLHTPAVDTPFVWDEEHQDERETRS